jgi:hypothetical protein
MTVGPGPQEPSGQNPYQQEPYQQEPYQQNPYQQSYSAMPPPPAGSFGTPPDRRPGMVTAAAVLAFIVGGLSILGGLLVLTASSLVGVSGIGTAATVVSFVVAAVVIWGGVQALNGKDARILTIAAAILILLNLITLIDNFAAIGLISFVIPILVLFFLLNPQSKAWFDRVGAKHF